LCRGVLATRRGQPSRAERPTCHEGFHAPRRDGRPVAAGQAFDSSHKIRSTTRASSCPLPIRKERCHFARAPAGAPVLACPCISVSAIRAAWSGSSVCDITRCGVPDLVRVADQTRCGCCHNGRRVFWLAACVSRCVAPAARSGVVSGAAGCVLCPQARFPRSPDDCCRCSGPGGPMNSVAAGPPARLGGSQIFFAPPPGPGPAPRYPACRSPVTVRTR